MSLHGLLQRSHLARLGGRWDQTVPTEPRSKTPFTSVQTRAPEPFQGGICWERGGVGMKGKQREQTGWSVHTGSLALILEPQTDVV